ncbi:MAG: ethylbenzene dehydrogenase-related protein [Dehalococcoidia bacterium]
MKGRRSVLQRGLAALAGGFLAWQWLRPRSAWAARPLLFARAVPEAPLDPLAEAWKGAAPLTVPLSPQVLVKPRLYRAGVEQLQVRALYDHQRIAFLLEWKDSQKDAQLHTVASFRDAVAIQFPADPSRPIPHFAMGEPGNPVVIYQWKADWDMAPDADVDTAHPGMAVDFYPFAGKAPGEIAKGADYGGPPQPLWPSAKPFNTAWWAQNPLADPDLKRKTSVEKLSAAGFASLTHQPPQEQDGIGKAVYREDGWHVVLSIPRQQTNFRFSEGGVVPINFAVWDGANGERGGEKAISSWSFLALERPTSIGVFTLPPLVAVGVAAILWALVRRVQATGRRGQH